MGLVKSTVTCLNLFSIVLHSKRSAENISIVPTPATN